MATTIEITNIIPTEVPMNGETAKRLHSTSSHASSGVHSEGNSQRNMPSQDSDSALNTTSKISSDNDTAAKEVPALPEGFTEDRFRVDRKRLESLLSQSVKMADNTSSLTRAEAFFLEVMNSTNTQVSWPSRLKVGAKSKKDPHIKITGPIEQVKIAKDKIMQQLDSKSSRVTIKMDVSHTEHSHVIGKGGANIKSVMKETECHIHFPDSNRNSHVCEKSNQVSIAGQGAGVELARQRIRQLLPITMFFEFPSKHIGNLDLNSPAIQNIVQTYNIAVQIKSRKPYSTILQVRGNVSNQIGLKDGVICLMQVLTGQLGQSIPVTSTIEIQNVQSFMNAKSVAKIKALQANTGITIDLPTDKKSSPIAESFSAADKLVCMTGSCEGVLYARQEIINQLPLVLMFDLKEEVSAVEATNIGEKFECFVSIKSKAKQATRSCIIKSSEANVYNMFKARQTLMGLSYNGLEDIPMPVNTASFLFNQKMQSVANYQMVQIQQAAQKQPGASQQSSFMPAFQKSTAAPTAGSTQRRPLQISARSINSMASTTPSRDSAATKSIDSTPSERLEKTTQNIGIIRQPTGPGANGFTSSTRSKDMVNVGNQKTGIKIASIQNKQGSCSSRDECLSSGNECHSSDLSDSESGKPVVSESYYKPISFRTGPPGFISSKNGINAMHKGIRQNGNLSSSTSDNSDDQVASKKPFSSNSQKSKGALRQHSRPASITDLFKSMGLDKYVESFIDQEIDITTFMTMSDNDLRELGVNTFGARRKMSMAIKELNKNNTSTMPSHTSTANISLRVGGK